MFIHFKLNLPKKNLKNNEKARNQANKNRLLKYTKSSFTSKTIDFSKINKDKIEEYIELMQEHQMNCVKARNFIEAELAKQRVIQLRKIKEKKQFKDATKRQGKETQDLKNTKIKELKAFNASFDIKYGEEMSKLEDMLMELKINKIKNFKNILKMLKIIILMNLNLQMI